MKRRNALAVGLLVSLSLTTVSMQEVASASVAPAAASAAAAAKSNVVGLGLVLNSGSPVKGATVVAVAQPSPVALENAGDKGLAVLPLGSTLTDAQGNFRIQADLASLPAQYVGSQGDVDVDLVASGPQGDTTWSLDLFPTTSTIPGVHVAPLSSEAVSTTGKLANDKRAPWVRFDLGTGQTTESADQLTTMSKAALKNAVKTGRARPLREIKARRSAKLVKYAQSYLKSRARTAPASLKAKVAAAPCTSQWGPWKYGVSEYFAKVYSASGIPVTLTEGSANSTTHTMGVALVGSGGTLSASGTTSVTSSVTVSQSNVINAVAYNSVNYRELVANCAPELWKPRSFRDYLTNFTNAGTMNFGTCSAKSNGSTWSTATAKNTTYSAGVDFGSINLSAQSGYSNSVDLTYHFNRAGSICGSSAQGAASSPQVSAK